MRAQGRPVNEPVGVAVLAEAMVPVIVPVLDDLRTVVAHLLDLSTLRRAGAPRWSRTAATAPGATTAVSATFTGLCQSRESAAVPMVAETPPPLACRPITLAAPAL